MISEADQTLEIFKGGQVNIKVILAVKSQGDILGKSLIKRWEKFKDEN